MFEKIKQMFSASKKSEDKKTILTVEDNEIDRRIIKNILEKKYKVLTASDGAAGFKMAKKYKPDLILLDCEMPVMSGNEMCRLTKEDDELKDIPVLFLTSINSPKNIIECFELDAENHISKPIKPRVLSGQIDAILTDHKGKQEKAAT